MTRSLLLVLLVSLLSGCGAYYGQNEEEVIDLSVTNSIPELEYVVISYGNTLEDNERLFLLDSRAWYDENGCNRICMSFRTQRLVKVCEARDIIVHLVEGFLERVNGDPMLPLYVNNFPFSPENLKINIEFESFFGKYVDAEYMARVKLEDGIVFYYANSAIDPNDSIWEQRVEPYEKAYRFSIYKHMDDEQRKQEQEERRIVDELPYKEFDFSAQAQEGESVHHGLFERPRGRPSKAKSVQQPQLAPSFSGNPSVPGR